MEERRCEGCDKSFDYSEKMYICNQCSARLCFSCSGAGGASVCTVCKKAVKFLEMTFQP